VGDIQVAAQLQAVARKGVCPHALVDAVHQHLSGPIVVIWDNLNTHVSQAMAERIAARPWLTVFRLSPCALVHPESRRPSILPTLCIDGLADCLLPELVALEFESKTAETYARG
jgi:hypothetical protein